MNKTIIGSIVSSKKGKPRLPDGMRLTIRNNYGQQRGQIKVMEI